MEDQVAIKDSAAGNIVLQSAAIREQHIQWVFEQFSIITPSEFEAIGELENEKD